MGPSQSSFRGASPGCRASNGRAKIYDAPGESDGDLSGTSRLSASGRHEHPPWYQCFSRRRVGGAGKRRRLGRGGGGGAAQPPQAPAPASFTGREGRLGGRGCRPDRARSPWRSLGIPRPTSTRSFCSPSRCGLRSPSWSRIVWPTWPRSVGWTRRWSPRWGSSGGRGAPRSTPVEHHKSHIASAFFISPFEGGGQRSRSTASAELRLDDDGGGARSRTSRSWTGSSSRTPRACSHHGYPRSSLGFSPVRRGVEDDGAGALRKAALRRAAPSGHPPRRGRPVRAQPRLFSAPQQKGSR